VHFPLPLVFLALVGAGVAVGRWMWPFAVPLAFWPRITAGAVVTLAGATLVISARIWFTRTGQNNVPWAVAGIAREGHLSSYAQPYVPRCDHFSVRARHFARQFVDLHPAPVALAIVHFIAVRPEEAYLADKFGESYLRYMAEVRRCV
jgi:protein-S-isoprenylcysteine O-methyltransferase Ste14